MKKYIGYLVLVIIVIVTIFGFRAWQTNKALEITESPKMVDGLLAESIRLDGEDYLIPPNEIYDSGFSAEDLPPINDSKFVSVLEADEYLADEVEGVDVEIFGEHRFYSYQILNWHSVVNDETIAVTHCVLCKSARVYRRMIDGEKANFSASGQVYNNNILLTDDVTENVWLQGKGISVIGDRIGDQLDIYPYEIMTWATWKGRYPNGSVLSTDTGYDRDYTSHPYANYDIANLIFFPLNNVRNDISFKWEVNTVDLNGEQYTFVDAIMKGFGVANEVAGGQPIVGIYDFSEVSTRVYMSTVFYQDDPTEDSLNEIDLTFTYDFEEDEIKDNETGSTWDKGGNAIAGELKGNRLQRLYAPESFWMCASSDYPNTKIVSSTLPPEENVVEVILTEDE